MITVSRAIDMADKNFVIFCDPVVSITGGSFFNNDDDEVTEYKYKCEIRAKRNGQLFSGNATRSEFINVQITGSV